MNPSNPTVAYIRSNGVYDIYAIHWNGETITVEQLRGTSITDQELIDTHLPG